MVTNSPGKFFQNCFRSFFFDVRLLNIMLALFVFVKALVGELLKEDFKFRKKSFFVSIVERCKNKQKVSIFNFVEKF